MKPNYHNLLGAVIMACLCVFVVPLQSSASSITAAHLYPTFIEPGGTDPLPNEGGQCAATALINSFVFLRNMYPDIYGPTSITRGNSNSLHDARNDLSEFVQCGASFQSIWEGKLQWVANFAQGTTIFHGMVDGDFSGWIGEAFLTRGAPTLEFLLQQIRDGQDVEIRFSGEINGERFGHMVTLSGVRFDDSNNNGRWDTGEAATIDYIDPNCVRGRNGASPGPMTVDLFPGSAFGDDRLHFAWLNGNLVTCVATSENVPVIVGIDFAYAESPVPEPSTLFLFATGLVSFAFMWRKKQHM
jgi:hypothetical protein